jgi:hypothetical protein
MLDTNIKGLMYYTHKLFPKMRERKRVFGLGYDYERCIKRVREDIFLRIVSSEITFIKGQREKISPTRKSVI